MSDMTDTLTSNSRGDKRRGPQSIVQSLLPQIFDPEPVMPDEWDTPDEGSILSAARKWELSLEPSDLNMLKSVLDGQAKIQCQAWQSLYRFGAKANEMNIVIDGTYIRVLGRTAKNSSAVVFPVFQVIKGGAIFGPSALGDPSGSSAVEACFCVEPGSVIQVKNPSGILKIDAVSMAMAKSRNRDEKWLQEKMFVLQRSEDRVRSLIKSLARWKELDESESKLTFTHSVSQSALADSLGMSDNTLRPYLKCDSFEWLAGKLWMSRDFVASTGRSEFDF